MKRLAIIPAREGSKRIPLKNIRDFCGKPMIAHAIETAKTSGLFDTIHVSTDSEKIAAIAAQSGVKPAFLRDAALAEDHTPMMEVIKATLAAFDQRGEKFDTIALLYATSPLTDPEDLKQACAQFEASDKSRALLAVTPYSAPIEKAFRMDGGALAPDNEKAFAGRSQDLKPAYHDAAMFAFYTPAFIRERQGAGDFKKFAGYIVPPHRVTDIDNPEDWTRAESLYKALQK